MNKEELEKYTVDFMNSETRSKGSKLNSVMGKILIRYAEIFQKQIQIDAEQIIALQKQNGELTDKVKELENAIEGYKNQIFYKEKALAKVKKEKDRIVHRITKDKKRLIRRNIEYKAQVEKMKCWCNCKNYLSCLEECCRKNISFEKGICYNCKKWEIKK